jgi:membrane-bound lytic murein transglycosylase D
VDYPVDLRLVAECVDSTPGELQDLNPSLLRLTTPKEGKFELHLPAGSKEKYETAIAAIPADKRLWWRYHKVQSGETLAFLARNYHTTARSITEVNHLEGEQLESDARIIIPVAPGKHPLNDTATYARRITRYKVRKGDTVETVAENFGVPPQMIRRWNGLHGDSLRGRRVVALHLPISPRSADTEVASGSKPKHNASSSQMATIKARTPDESDRAAVVRHTVKHGETLYSIATAYRPTVAALKRDKQEVGILRPGMILGVQPAK